MASISCPRCGGRLQLDPQYAGWQVRCPHCANEFVAATAAAPSEPPVAAVAPADEFRPPPAEAGRKLIPPAVALLVVAVLGLGCFGATFLGFMVDPNQGANDPRRNDPAFRLGFQIGRAGVLVVMPVWSIATAAGAGCMLTRRAYPLAVAGCVVAMLPCNHMCLLGLPFGIWGLVTLRDPAVREAFEAARR